MSTGTARTCRRRARRWPAGRSRRGRRSARPRRRSGSPPAAGSPLRSRRATGMKMAATRAVANSSRIMNFVSRSVIVCPNMSQDQWGRGTRSSGIRPTSFTPYSEGTTPRCPPGPSRARGPLAVPPSPRVRTSLRTHDLPRIQQLARACCRLRRRRAPRPVAPARRQRPARHQAPYRNEQ